MARNIDRQPEGLFTPKTAEDLMRLKYTSLLNLKENVLLASQKFNYDDPNPQFMGGQTGLYLPEEFFLWGLLNTKMAKTVTLGSANPLTVTILGGWDTKNDLYLPGRRQW